MSAPARTKQPSRKTKSAWRKNINLEDVTTGLDSARDELRASGGQGLLADAPEASLFQTDVAGDIGIQRKTIKEHGKLKVDEILAQRSAVPAVAGRKRASSDRVTDGLISKKQKQGNGVSPAEYKRLRQLAYGNSTALSTSSSTADAETTSLTLHDPWTVTKQPTPPPNQSWLTPAPTAKAPPTLTHAPIPLTASGKAPSHIPKPRPHKSYNPVFADWTAALDTAGAAELAAETKRLEVQRLEAEREARVAAAGAEAERHESGAAGGGYASGGENSEWESEWEGILSASEGEGRRDLKSKRPSRKTPAERNKIKRRKEADALYRHEAKMRARDESIKRLDALTKELKAKGVSERAIAATKAAARARAMAITKVDSGIEGSDSESSDSEIDARVLRKARFGQRAVPDAPLELVLADELESSLRRLKPEGNLLDERFRNMIVQGRVEARPRPLGQQKARRVKRTEKWGFKDWSVDDVVK